MLTAGCCLCSVICMAVASRCCVVHNISSRNIAFNLVQEYQIQELKTEFCHHKSQIWCKRTKTPRIGRITVNQYKQESAWSSGRM
ncbi:hypothetical protein Nepgr_008574 [Nepenthes gracilis]|uniref:Secreted protein n=1 Tax=Nepenthes gracilis TaxID=150966 RepID=A0AAD3XJE4_NEPGR|nr:hypothetical protein Nepgr_008574 [Nepenthes gracilis]